MIRLFRVSIPANTLLLLVADVVLVVFCYAGMLYFTTDAAPRVYLFEGDGIWRVLLVAAVVLLGLYFHDLYGDFRLASRIRLVQNIGVALGAAFVLQALLSYAGWSLLLPKWDMVLGSGAVLVLMPAWRAAFSAAVSGTAGDHRVLFLGAGASARKIMAGLEKRPELGWKAVGYLDGDMQLDAVHVPRLGGFKDLSEIVAACRPDRLVVSLPDGLGPDGLALDGLPMERLLELRTGGLLIEEAAESYEYVLQRVSCEDLRLSDLVFSKGFGSHPRWILAQNLYSWILAASMGVVLLPVMAVVAALVKLTSPGPVLFRQTRTGLHGAPFVLLKFRSMRQDAEAETGAVWAKRVDSRVTPLGRWLRRSRLDELPQLLNVLRGEMALVGPRPERPEFIAALQAKIPFYSQRHNVKPGITGWAQINHKYGNSMDDAMAKLEYDLYYIKHGAASLDFYILFHTFKTMLLGRGAQ